MKKHKTIKEFKPGLGFTKEDWDAVSDNPELTDEELSEMRPFEEVFPDLAASIRRVRGKQKAPTKVRVTLRLDRATVEAFKAGGPGWQSRIDEALKKVTPG
jgi:uncharacterized protein (DUF4415 family)